MKLRAIFASFLFISLATFALVIFSIESKYFASFSNKMLSVFLDKRFGIQAKFKNVDISLFPLGVSLVNPEIKSNTNDYEFELQAGSLGFYLSLLSIEEKRFNFTNFAIEEAHVKIVDKTQSDEEITEIDPQKIKSIFQLVNLNPVRLGSLELNRVLIEFNKTKLDIDLLKVFYSSSVFEVIGKVNKISHEDKRYLDMAYLDLSIFEDKVFLDQFEVLNGVQKLGLAGKIKNYYKLKNSDFDLSFTTTLDLPNLSREISEFPDWLKLDEGWLKAKGRFSGDLNNTQAEIDLEINDMRSNVLFVDNLSLKTKIQDNMILINSLNFKYQNQQAVIDQPFPLWKIGSDVFDPSFLVQLNKVKLSNALRYLKKTLEPLESEVTGKIKVKFQNKNLKIEPVEEVIASNVDVILGEDFQLVKIPSLKLLDGSFSVIDEVFYSDIRIKGLYSDFKLTGKASGDLIDLQINQGKIDLDELGNIADIGLMGKGILNFQALGHPDQVTLSLNGNLDEAKIIGYQLGSSKIDITIPIHEKKILVKNLNSKYRQSGFVGKGYFDFGEMRMDLNFESKKLYFSDAREILLPVFEKMDFISDDAEFEGVLICRLFGNINAQDIKILAQVAGKNVTYWKENADSLDFNLNFTNKILTLDSILLKKNMTTASGSIWVDLNQDTTGIDFKWNNLLVHDLNFIKSKGLNLKSTSNGTAKGGGKLENYEVLINSQIVHEDLDDPSWNQSNVSLIFNPQFIMGKFLLYGERIVVDMDYQRGGLKNSLLDVQVDTNEIKPLLSSLLGNHLKEEPLSGELKFNFSTDFNKQFVFNNMVFGLKRLRFTHPEYNVNFSSNDDQLIVKNGKIEKWNLSVTDADLYFSTTARGNLSTGAFVKYETNLKAKILQILSTKIISSEGMFSLSLNSEVSQSKVDVVFFSKTRDLSLSLEGVPFVFNNINYDLEYSDSRLTINSFNSKIDQGDLNFKGDVYFDDNDEPDINIRYYLNEATIPVLSKSSVTVSGEGVLLGNNFPYNLAGEMRLERGLIINEINEFESQVGTSNIRYLPKDRGRWWENLINLNLNFKTMQPLRFRNSLFDVSLVGNLTILGGLNSLSGEGRLTTPAQSSRVFFKNNEYLLQNVDIIFVSRKPISSPNFDISAISFISNYQITAKASGYLERFSFDVMSDPALSKNSILSLIAFGYTDEMENDLTAESRQDLTQMGVGSFVFDRFKVVDILKKQLGLQVNLGTQFEQTQTSMLAGGGQDPGGLGRTRSATKVEVRKRLNEALSLSVSSTMGGSIGQRQSMNLNYNINKNLQLEGIYELRTNVDGEEDVIDTSIGGDLKLRWSFK